MKITKCIAREIMDSRGVPTVEVEMSAGSGAGYAGTEGITVIASVPSGKSTGSREAVELRDEDGRGVSRAVANVNDVIAPEIIGKDVELKVIDELMLELDGTKDKSRLGANAMLAVSIAVVKLGAFVAGEPVWKFIARENGFTPKLPKLFMNIINGGAHGDFSSPFQEYIIVPSGESLTQDYEKAKNIIDILGRKLEGIYGDVSMGDEGGYSPKTKTVEEPFEVLSSVIDKNTSIAIDVAGSEFYKSCHSCQGLPLAGVSGDYEVLGKNYSSDELLSLYKKLTEDFNILAIEDPFEESDVESFAKLTKEVGDGVLIVGDDLTTTNPSIITQMVEKKAADAVIIKPNQIGTISETCKTVKIANDAGWKVIASHRSGETEDTFISDFAVGVGVYGIKAGSPLQKERRVKYDRLLEIEKEMN